MNMVVAQVVVDYFLNNVTFTSLRYSCSQMQSHDLNSKFMKSSREKNTDSDSFPVSCWIVPWMMFKRIVGFPLHQLINHITSDLFLSSSFPQNMICELAFLFFQPTFCLVSTSIPINNIQILNDKESWNFCHIPSYPKSR